MGGLGRGRVGPAGRCGAVRATPLSDSEGMGWRLSKNPKIVVHAVLYTHPGRLRASIDMLGFVMAGDRWIMLCKVTCVQVSASAVVQIHHAAQTFAGGTNLGRYLS